MAGTLVANTINTDTGLFSTNNAYSGIAKAWGNFNGTSSPSTRATFNLSSFTRVSAGIYTVAFATPMTDANYSVNINWSDDANGTVGSYQQTTALFTTNFSSLTAPTTSGFGFALNWSGGGNPQPTYICISVLGN